MKNLRLLRCLMFAAAIAPLGHCQDSETASKRFQEGMELYNGNNLDGARAKFEEAVAADSGFTNARIALGKIEYYNRKFAEAERTFQAAVDKDEASINALIWLARAQSMQEGGNERALQTLNRIVERGSGEIEAWRLKGMIHEGRGETDQAIAAYSNAVNEARKGSRASIQLAALYRRAGLSEMAEKHFEYAMLLSGGDPAVRRELEALRNAAVSGNSAVQPDDGGRP